MSDIDENPPVEDTTQDEPIPAEKPKRKMSEAQMKNLEKARLAAAAKRKANLVKYPEKKRQAAEKRIQEDVISEAQKLAEKLADDLLKKRDEEQRLKMERKELEELRKLKASWEELQNNNDESQPKKSKKKAEKSVAKKSPARSKSPRPRKPRPLKKETQPPITNGNYYDPLDDLLS